MEEMERMRSDIGQLTRRVDDVSMRLAAVEATTKSFDEKIDERFDALKELIEAKLTPIKASIDGWNKIGFWLLTLVGGGIVIAILNFLIRGGFAP